MNAYIIVKQGIVLSLDYNAIKITGNMAARWIPLAQVNQLFIYGYIDIPFCIINKCFQLGVNIHFHDNNNYYLGSSISSKKEAQDICVLSEMIFESAHKEEILHQYLKNQSRILLNSKRRQINFFTKKQYYKFIYSWISRYVSAEMTKKLNLNIIQTDIFQRYIKIIVDIIIYNHSAFFLTINIYPLTHKKVIDSLEKNISLVLSMNGVIRAFFHKIEMIYYEA